MKIITQLFRLNRYLNILAQQVPFSIARLEVLRLIKNHNPITPGQLCQIQQVSMPTMSKLVDELQSSSLIIRAQAKDDGRQRLIFPTQKGIQILKQMEALSDEFWQQKLTVLDRGKQEEIEQILTLLNQALKPE